MSEEKQTLLEMIIGTIISVIIIGFIGIVIVEEKGTFALGTCFGGIIAITVLIQMYRSLSRTLELDSESAQKYATKHAVFRLLIMALAIVIGVVLPSIFNVFGVLLGILSLKLSAYLQPMIHKIIRTKNIM